MLALRSILFACLLCLHQASALMLAKTPTERDGLVPVPVSLSRHTPRQVTRSDLLRRIAARNELSKRKQALQPRQSAIVYPSCQSTDIAAVPSSGFAQFPGWSVDRSDPAYNVAGSLTQVTSAIACAMLCQSYDGCEGFSWGSGVNTCTFRQGRPTGAAFTARDDSVGTFAMRGSCASLSSQINNPAIMATCCDNSPPSSRNVCTAPVYQGFEGWCIKGQERLGTNNALSAAQGGYVTVTGSYQSCIDACAALTARNLPNAGIGCTSFFYDGNRVANGVNNCFLYGGNPTINTPFSNVNTVTFTKGTCAQAAANGVNPGMTPCDST